MSPVETFSAGGLAFRLETGTGIVRDIRWHGREVLRAIYPAVRDAHWRTLVPDVSAVERRPGDGLQEILLSARVATDGLDLSWSARITAQASGSLEYQWRGRVVRRGETNRTGLCVLHPADLAGCSCVIEQADGTSIAGSFPGPIAPHQPFRNIRAITHSLPAGIEVTVRMEGEVFEMEDQRNWTDASFKTYCRPLDWPRPYTLGAGAEIEHVVRLQVTGQPAPASRRLNYRLAEPKTHTPRPRLGFSLPAPIPAALRERLAALRPHHLRVETTAAQLKATLAWARPEAESFDCELHLAVLDAPASPPPRTSFPARLSVSLFDAGGNTADARVLRAWRDAGFDSLVTGTRNNFAELNRARPPADAPHTAVCFGINAQAHAFDDASLLETLTQHAVVARQAAVIAAGRPVHVAPIILGPAADSDDPRLRSEFAALWTLGSLAALAHAGVESATYFHTHGAGGVLREGPASPLEYALADIAGASAVSAVPLEPASGEVHLLEYETGSSRRFVGVNLTEAPVTLEGAPLPQPVELAPRILTPVTSSR